MSSYNQTRIKPLDELKPKLKQQDSEIVISMGFQDKIKQTNMYPKAKPSAFVRKNSIFVSKPVKSKKVTEMYQNMLHSIDGQEKKSLKSTKKKVSKTTSKSNHRKPLELPTKAIDTLYRQNIKNYNAFTSTLQVLEEESGMSAIEKQRTSKLCHIGTAKEFLKAKKYSEGPTYNRVNVQIRPYMRQKMYEVMKSNEQKYQNVIFIPTNELALSFNPYNYPQQLQDSINEQNYQVIIRQVNSIIETEYVGYKALSNHMFTESFLVKILLVLILMLAALFFLNPVKEILGVAFALAIVWLFATINECKGKLHELVRSKDMTNTISEKINKFFEKISTEQTEWRVGQDFYWLQVHFIKKKKVNRYK